MARSGISAPLSAILALLVLSGGIVGSIATGSESVAAALVAVEGSTATDVADDHVAASTGNVADFVPSFEWQEVVEGQAIPGVSVLWSV